MMFSQKDRYVFRKRSACFSKKICMFSEKDLHVFRKRMRGQKISLCIVKRKGRLRRTYPFDGWLQ